MYLNINIYYTETLLVNLRDPLDAAGKNITNSAVPIRMRRQAWKDACILRASSGATSVARTLSNVVPCKSSTIERYDSF